MTKKILTRLTLGLALLAAPSVFLGCGEEASKPPEATPGPAATPGGGDAAKPAPGGAGDAAKPASPK